MDARLRQRLAQRLAWQRQVHDVRRDPRNRLPVLSALRRWQSARLAGSFADLLADPTSRAAAEFFLSDLYGDRDFSARDRDVARILPAMARILPDGLLRAPADAIELAVLSHGFDLAMAERLADRRSAVREITAERYAEAYRSVGCPRLRVHQIALVGTVGRALDAAVQRHGVYRLLRASRLPAQLAGLSELQGFLERGFTAFAGLGGATRFLGEIDRRERAVSARLFAGDPDPFRPA